MINYKKILAVSLAGAMVLGNASAVFAADQEASAGGSGNLEYVAKKDVFDLVFPTVAENATTFDYILDPKGLIAETEGAKYSGKKFDDGKTVYFLRSAQVDGTVGGNAGKADYTDSSDELKVVNKSTQDINLVINAKVEEVDGITMKSDTTFGTTEPELYLAIKGTDGTNAAENTAITTTGVEITKKIAADSNAYEVKWNSTLNQYEKQLTTAASGTGYTGFKTYTFQVTGACNQVDGWDDLKDKAPKIDLVWSVKDFTVTGPQISMNNSGLITMTGFTAAQNYSSLAVTDGEGTKWDIGDSPFTWDLTNYDAATGGDANIQLSDRWINFLIEKGGDVELELTLTDGTVKTFTITIS